MPIFEPKVTLLTDNISNEYIIESVEMLEKSEAYFDITVTAVFKPTEKGLFNILGAVIDTGTSNVIEVFRNQFLVV